MRVIDRFRAGAALTLFAIIMAVWLYWPLPDLGFEADPVRGIVVGVAPNSAAAQGGLLPGDQIISIYDYPMSAINTRVLLVPLPWREGMTSPLQVQRNGTRVDLTLRPDRPSLALQIDKALRALVALTCWATGMLIAMSPQAANRRHQWAAWFWMILGAALGLLLLVQIVSELLTVAVLWLLCTILAPAAVVMHVWYPGRPIPPAIERRTRRWWLISMLGLQILFLGLASIRQTAYGLHKLLDTATTLAFLTSFALSAAILWRAYRATTISHIRRQIRLIVWACATVACVWLILVLGAIAAPQLLRLVPPVTLTVVAIIVPLAYLIGSVNVDLLRVDLLARRLVLEASTLLAITALLAAATQVGFFAPAPTLLAVVVIALYRPTQRLIRRAPVFGLDHERPYERLSEATTRLGSTLAAASLATIISDGVRATFHDPPLALYLKRKPRGAVLERITSYRLNPPTVAATPLIEQVFGRVDVLLSSGTIQQRVEQLPLEDSSEQLVFAPSVSLWGVIRNTQGEPIGLLLLGPRGDHDPYRAQDLRELGRLLSAAALAFTNSASFEQLARASRLIRRLYHRVQQIQDQTVFRISRELHHEVKPSVRLNIAKLEWLISRAAATAPELVAELEALLADEQTVINLIRMVCEDLLPVDPREPMGLAASVDKTAEKATVGWEGRRHVLVEQLPVAVPSHVQRELLSITREAITNAVKHANADEIVVELRFPLQPDEPLRLSIRDNGPLQQEVEPKAGHLGLHFMQESADAIGATITWLVRETGGTEVRVVAPRNGRQEQEEDAELDDWWSGEQLAAEASSQGAAELSAANRHLTSSRREATVRRTTHLRGPIQLLRESAKTRSVAYLSSMVGVLLVAGKLPYNHENPFEANGHEKAFPGVVGVTNLFTYLRPEDRAGWDQPPTGEALADLARGALLGAAACTAMLSVAGTKGWVSAPAWGWQSNLAPGDVLASAALLAAQEATLVFNEEMVFRGYGLDTLTKAFGQSGALALSIGLFARYHGPGWKRFLGLSLAGALLALLRLRTGNLWHVAGFHWGWNIAQKSIFGPPDGAPSLRPLQLHGPPEWVGRPGHPDPGWLQIATTTVMTLVAGLAFRRTDRRKRW